MRAVLVTRTGVRDETLEILIGSAIETSEEGETASLSAKRACPPRRKRLVDGPHRAA
jgi:hypothetical protein